jgi:hypothetical protein
MNRSAKIALLCVLAVILGYLGYRSMWPASVASAVPAPGQRFVPLPVENPALRLDLLEQVKKFEYQGPRRNIFDLAPPPPPAKAANAPTAPVVPPPPPPLTVPATFFGYIADARTGTRRALFSQGDDVFILGVGEILDGRFRLVQIGNSTAELEETSSGRRTTLTMEEPNASGS